MLAVFEIHMAPGTDPDTLLTPEIIRETQAQMMTASEARAVGFAGIPEGMDMPNLRLIAVAKRDASWVRQRLESNAGVAGFKMHEVG